LQRISWVFARRLDKGIAMEFVLWVVHVLVAVAVIGLVLMQHGKGADMGAAFGSGASGSLFGATGSANFLSRTTAVLATAFFLTSLGLAWFSSTHQRAGEIVVNTPVQSTLPVAPVVPAPADAIPK
jgi:preprotein translocase subunit SecG